MCIGRSSNGFRLVCTCRYSCRRIRNRQGTEDSYNIPGTLFEVVQPPRVDYRSGKRNKESCYHCCKRDGWLYNSRTHRGATHLWKPAKDTGCIAFPQSCLDSECHHTTNTWWVDCESRMQEHYSKEFQLV